MNKYGFYIKKLEVLGDTVKPSIIEFTKGLNVIYGASDTGKTFIYECINYMLGDSKVPKITIEEAKGYTHCILEIETFKGKNHLLTRCFNSEEITVNTEKEPLNAGNRGKKKSISDFLLTLCNIKNKNKNIKIKSAKGKTKELYFKYLKKIFVVDEVKIIDTQSPILSGQNSEKVFDANLFKFILTGEDDSNLVVLLTKDETIERNSQVALYNEIIESLDKEVIEDDSTTIDNKIKELDEEIKVFEKKYAISNQEFQEDDREKNALFKKIQENENELIGITEVLQRGDILQRQYESDISRLKASKEAGYAFDLFSITTCPVCNNEVSSSNIMNYQNFLTSAKYELKKIILLMEELKESQNIFFNDKTELSKKLVSQNKEYDKLLEKFESDFNLKLKEISFKIKEFSQKRESLLRIQILQEKLNDYIEKKDEIVGELQEDKEKSKPQNVLSTERLSEIVKLIKEILIDINFDYSTEVGFSDKELDFTFGEKRRKDFGKGYRAILYAVFIISMLKYLKTKKCQIGFAIIDTPLNPYKPDDKDDGGVVGENLANNFYRYLAENIKDEQVILIENTDIPNDIVDKVKYHKFSKGNGFLKGNVD
jgi:uncharacterized small protein (DUF1192 family)